MLATTRRRDKNLDDNADAREAMTHVAARRAAKHASAVIRAMQDALLVVDEKGRITDVNDALCAMTGFERHRLVGKRSSLFWSRDDANSNDAAIDDALRQIETSSSTRSEVDIWITRRDGSRVAARAVICPLWSSEGTTMGYASTLRLLEEAPPAGPAAAITPAGQTHVQQALQHAAASLNEVASPRTTLSLIAEQAAWLTGAEIGQIIQLSDTAATIRATWGASNPTVWERQPIVDADVLAQARAGIGVHRERSAHPDPFDTSLTTVIAEPIMAGATVWGVFVVATTQARTPLSATARIDLHAFVQAIGLAVMRVDAQAAADGPLLLDPTTGLASRGAFDAHLQREVGRAVRYGRNLTLVLLDIDQLRWINAERGLDAGDHALVLVATAVSRCSRAGDVVARLAGDMFGWLLPETSASEGVIAAERARMVIAAIDAGHGRIHVSIGATDLRSSGGETGILVRQATLAVRAAKRAGGDRTVSYAERPSASPPVAPRLTSTVG